MSSPLTGRPSVAGIPISHPDRLVFPSHGVTKVGLAHYYERIAEWVLPHVEGRPLTLVRCPEGVSVHDSEGHGCFYMKHSQVWAPAALRRVRIREKTKIGEYLVADTVAAIVGLVQMGVVEIHTWNSRIERLEQPDRVVIDLDPGARVSWREVVDAAREVRDLLAAMDLASFVKTTGGRGLHVVVPLTPAAGWSECLEFARTLAEAMARRTPAVYTTAFSKAGREDRILVDYLRNNRTNTSIAAYSTRARPSAPISVPLAWSELSPRRPPDRFTIASVPARLDRLRQDPWHGYGTVKQRLPRAAARALDRM